MDLLEGIFKRRSIRKYADTPVSDEEIHTLLEAAMHAPSACNKRPWEFYVVKNQETREKLRSIHRYANIVSPLVIVVVANTKRSLSSRLNDFYIQDCSAAIENILLASMQLNLGTCWNGIYPTIAPTKRVREILNLEDTMVPIGLIHIGHPLEEPICRGKYDKKRVHEIWDR